MIKTVHKILPGGGWLGGVGGMGRLVGSVSGWVGGSQIPGGGWVRGGVGPIMGG